MIRNNRYEVKLPIKDKLIELLPDNCSLSRHPLKGLRTHLCKDKGLMIQYNNMSRIIQIMVYTERVDAPADKKELVQSIIYRISHHLTMFFTMVPAYFRSYKRFYYDFELEKQALQLMSNRPSYRFQLIRNTVIWSVFCGTRIYTRKIRNQ